MIYRRQVNILKQNALKAPECLSKITWIQFLPDLDQNCLQRLCDDTLQYLGSLHSSYTFMCKSINPSLVLVQARKNRPYITERLLMGCKESNQTNKTDKNLCVLAIAESSAIIWYK